MPEDNYVLMAYKHFLEQPGSNALRAAVGKLCVAEADSRKSPVLSPGA